MPKKIDVTFDNFTYLDDKTERWMDPADHAALPELHDCHAELWENYKRARAAHEAACLAVQFAMKYPDGSAQAEVERQHNVLEHLRAHYSDWTNNKDQAAGIMERMGEILKKETERG